MQTSDVRRSHLPRRFWVGYGAIFSAIWIGAGLLSVMKGAPSSGLVLAFGIAFTVVFCGAVWFSSWLLSRYRKLDARRHAGFQRGKSR